jgi:hypothetical protein
MTSAHCCEVPTRLQRSSLIEGLGEHPTQDVNSILIRAHTIVGNHQKNPSPLLTNVRPFRRTRRNQFFTTSFDDHLPAPYSISQYPCPRMASYHTQVIPYLPPLFFSTRTSISPSDPPVGRGFYVSISFLVYTYH